MSFVIQSIRKLFSPSSYPTSDRDEQYLADSTDIHDLERRMRQLDSGRQNLYAIGANGVFTR